MRRRSSSCRQIDTLRYGKRFIFILCYGKTSYLELRCDDQYEKVWITSFQLRFDFPVIPNIPSGKMVTIILI